MARTEFALAAKLRPRKVSDFNGPEYLRRDLIESINDYRREQNEVLIGDFKPDTFRPSDSSFLRIGSGSLGGKARGLAFVRHLLRTRRITRRFPGVRISVPPAVVIATDHSSYDYGAIVDAAKLVVDSRNATRRVVRHREKIVLC